MYVAVNFITFVAYFAAFCSWGYVVCGSRRNEGWMPAVGIACCTIVATLGLECGLPVSVSGGLIFTIAAGGGLLWLFRKPRRWRSPPPATVVICVLVALVLIAPMAIGGPQFALFQLNINDQFNYLATAAMRTTETHRSIETATRADFIKNSLMPIAHTMSGARPAIVDLYATLEGLLPGNLHRCHYGFLCAFMMGSFFAVAEFLSFLCGAVSWRAHLIAAAYVTGFWGQLQFDLNAWSWTAATPLAAASIGMLASMPPWSGTMSEDERPDWRSGVTLGICTAGQIYIYPEMFVFLAPAAILVLGLATFFRPNPPHVAANYTFAAIAALALTVPKLAAILKFTFHQVLFSSKANFSPLDWMWQMIVGGSLTGTGAFESALRWMTPLDQVGKSPTDGRRERSSSWNGAASGFLSPIRRGILRHLDP